LTIYVSQGSAAADLRRGGNFNTTFLHRSFLNLIVKKMKIGPLLPKLFIINIKVANLFEARVIITDYLTQTPTSSKFCSTANATVVSSYLLVLLASGTHK